MAGRKTKLTPQVHDKIVKFMRDGNYFEVACRASGIGETTGYRWIAWGEGRDHGTLKCPPDTTIYSKFRKAIIEAEGKAETDAVGYIKLAAPGDWKAAAEYLKRRNPRRWNQGDKVQVEVSGEVSVAHEVSKVLKDYADAFAADDDADIVGDDG